MVCEEEKGVFYVFVFDSFPVGTIKNTNTYQRSDIDILPGIAGMVVVHLWMCLDNNVGLKWILSVVRGHILSSPIQT